MVLVGSMINEPMDFQEEDEFGKNFIKDTSTIKHPRKHKVNILQLTTGSQVAVEESTGVTISRIGRAELTLVCAVSVDDATYYGGQTVSITYKSNDGVTHAAIMTIHAVATDTEVAFYKTGVNSSDGINYGTVAVTDFYCLLTMTTSKVTDAGETIGCGSTGALTYGVIQAASTAALAADIHGIGDVFVRGHSDVASLQSKATKLKYFTPWGEQKFGIASTAANATTEVRYLVATSAFVSTGVYVGDFYRVITFVTDTVPAGGVYMILCDAACDNVNGVGGDIYGHIEEAIKEMLTSYFWAAPNRITYLKSIHMGIPAAAANGVLLHIAYTPYGHPHAVLEEHSLSGGSHHREALNLRIEPDTDVNLTIADIADPSTPSIILEYVYGKMTKAAELALVDGGV